MCFLFIFTLPNTSQQHLPNCELPWEIPESKLTSQPVVINPPFVHIIYVELNNHTHIHTHSYHFLKVLFTVLKFSHQFFYLR